MSAARAAPSAVVFDIGGVFLDWDPRHLYRKLIADEAELERFLAEVCTPSWHAEQDLGVTIAASVASLAAAHPEHAALIRAWEERNEEMVAGVITGTVAILDELEKAGVACYACTNMEPEAYTRRLARYPFMSRFAGTVVSSTEGCAKPDPALLARLVARYRLEPRAALFVDDRPANLDGAARLGFATHRFVSPELLRTDLVARGLLRATDELTRGAGR